MSTLTLSVRALGRKKPLLSDWSIPFPPDMHSGDSVTLRDVITRIVQSEVKAFQKRQRENQFLHALTADQMEQGAAKGKIDSGGKDLIQEVDVSNAVGVALQAFEDGLYLVIIDEAEQRNLDSQVYLKEDSRITFLRLTLLAGG